MPAPANADYSYNVIFIFILFFLIFGASYWIHTSTSENVKHGWLSLEVSPLWDTAAGQHGSYVEVYSKYIIAYRLYTNENVHNAFL